MNIKMYSMFCLINTSLTESLGGLQFGIDENGNYGYIKDGADTVTPFSGFDLLWENTAGTAVSDISLDLTVYQYVLLRCVYAFGNSQKYDFLVEVGASGKIITPASATSETERQVVYNRTLTVSTTGITFTGSNTTNTERCVPIMVYGIK